MSFKQKYVQFYDYFNSDKDYPSELSYISSFLPDRIYNVLEVGCGTGKFSRCLSSQGLKVTAIDPNYEMIKLARAANSGTNIQFFNQNLNDFKSTEKYDVIFLLFHVINYFTTELDLNQLFKKASELLKPSGFIVFDFWYTPAVLNIKPSKRIRTFENNYHLIKRTSTPTVLQDNLIRIQFKIDVTDKLNNSQDSFTDTHTLRHFSTLELKGIFEKYGISLYHNLGWLKKTPPTDKDWSSLIIARLK